MNWNQVASRWNDAAPDIKSEWTKLTDDDLRAIDANKDTLVAKIEDRYHVHHEDADVQVNAWLEKRSPVKEAGGYWVTVVVAIALGVLVGCFVFVRLPWGPGKYVVSGLVTFALMAILFQRWRRIEF